MSDDDITENWIYLGPSAGVKKKVYCWRTPEGETRIFGKVKPGLVVGYIYVVTLTSDKKSLYTNTPVWTGEKAEDYEEIFALSKREAREIESDALQRNAARQDVIKEAAEPLIEMASKMKSRSSRYALASYVNQLLIEAK